MERRIVEYELLRTVSSQTERPFGRMQELVNDRLKKGWELRGDLTVAMLSDEKYAIVREMVKYDVPLGNVPELPVEEFRQVT